MSLASQLLSDLEIALQKRGMPTGLPDAGSPVDFIRASSIGDCARKQTYRLLNPADHSAPSPHGMLMATQGNWIEDGLVPLIREAGYIITDQQRELVHVLDGEVILKGHIDGLILEDHGELTGDPHLWECKGMSAFRFRKLASNGVYIADPGYFDQVQTYMTLLNYEGERVRSCLFTAVAKDPSAVNNPRNGQYISPIYVEEIPWDESKGEDLLSRAEKIYDLFRAGELAPRERNPWKDWDCSPRFCEFFEVCDPKRAIRKEAA